MYFLCTPSYTALYQWILNLFAKFKCVAATFDFETANLIYIYLYSGEGGLNKHCKKVYWKRLLCPPFYVWNRFLYLDCLLYLFIQMLIFYEYQSFFIYYCFVNFRSSSALSVIVCVCVGYLQKLGKSIFFYLFI